jgi:imidazolonepropionase-like amidohydrolase
MKQLRNWLVLAVLISCIVASTARAQQSQPTPPPILVKAARLLDPRTGNVLSSAALLTANGKIKEVGPFARVQPNVPTGAKTIDLGSATLLPGLIDSHTHLLMDDIVYVAEAQRARHSNGGYAPAQLLAIVESPSKRVLIGAQMAREDLESGITTVRNLGHSAWMAIPNCATPSTRGAFQAQESWPPDAN